MYKTTKAVMDLDHSPHKAEQEMLRLVNESDSEAGNAIKQARLAGISWKNIFALLIQFGPQFAAMIQAIIAALKTPVPQALAEPDYEPKSNQSDDQSDKWNNPEPNQEPDSEPKDQIAEWNRFGTESPVPQSLAETKNYPVESNVRKPEQKHEPFKK